VDDIPGFDPEHRLLLETRYPNRFPSFERSHYARVIPSCKECCSDTRSRGCEGGGRGNHGRVDRRLGRAHLLSAIRADVARDLPARCRLDWPHRRRARGGPQCR
jgi:hypothetical protein